MSRRFTACAHVVPASSPHRFAEAVITKVISAMSGLHASLAKEEAFWKRQNVGCLLLSPSGLSAGQLETSKCPNGIRRLQWSRRWLVGTLAVSHTHRKHTCTHGC